MRSWSQAMEDVLNGVGWNGVVGQLEGCQHKALPLSWTKNTILPGIGQTLWCAPPRLTGPRTIVYCIWPAPYAGNFRLSYTTAIILPGLVLALGLLRISSILAKPFQEGYYNRNNPLVKGVPPHIYRPSSARWRPLNMWRHPFYQGIISVVTWVPPHRGGRGCRTSGFETDFWGLNHPYSWARWQKIASIQDYFEASPTPTPTYSQASNIQVPPSGATPISL